MIAPRAVLFGDGAGRSMLGPSEQPGILSTHLHANGAFADPAVLSTGPSRLHHAGVSRQNAIHMQGPKCSRRPWASWRESSRRRLADNGLDRSDIDWLVPHQANLRLIQRLRRNCVFRWSA